jgi:hypothetical protein
VTDDCAAAETEYSVAVDTTAANRPALRRCHSFPANLLAFLIDQLQYYDYVVLRTM